MENLVGKVKDGIKRKITTPLKRKIHTRILIDNNPDHQASVLIAGSGRSGTTWVSQNIINYDNEYRYMFEPFHPKRVPACSEFRNRQYLRPENASEEFLGPARSIFTGRIRNEWTDRLNTRFVSDKRLIKDIRVNLSLKWIHTHFPGMPLILLFRHPCAVAHSEIQQKWLNWLDDLTAQEELMEDFFVPFKKEIEQAESLFEKHVLLWCMENYVALKQFRKGEIHLAFYENFCDNPDAEISKLFTHLGKKFVGADAMNLNKKSPAKFQQSRRDSLINGWRKQITDDQTRRAVEILSAFGLDAVYNEDSMPDPEGAYRLMQSAPARPASESAAVGA